MRFNLFGLEIVVRRPIPRNTEEVNTALWNRSPHTPTPLGELNEAQLRNELYVVQHNLSIGLCAVMTQDGHRSILFHPRGTSLTRIGYSEELQVPFHPRGTSPTVLTGKIID